MIHQPLVRAARSLFAVGKHTTLTGLVPVRVDRHSNFVEKPAGIVKIFSNFDFPGMDDTMTLEVSNRNAYPETYSVFGTNFKGAQPFGVSAQVPESSLDQATRESAFRGFMIKSLKMRVSDPNQFNEPVIITVQSMTGKKVVYQLQPMNYLSPTQAQPNFISIPDINIPVWSDVNISGTIGGNTDISFIMKLKKVDGPSSFIAQDASLDQWYESMQANMAKWMYGQRIPGGTIFVVNQ